MEIKCSNDTSLNEDDKTKLRTLYEKEQIALEFCFENVANILWYYAIDEQGYGHDNVINLTIKEDKELTVNTFIQVISTPIVASACPNMFGVFTEVLL
jgi:hypothetical protein